MSSAAIPKYLVKPAVTKQGWCGWVVQEFYRIDEVDGVWVYRDITEVLNREQAEQAFKHLTGGSHD